MSNTPTNQRLLYSSLEDLNQAAIAQMIEIDDDTPLEIYFETAKNLLKEAKLSKESQDLEGMYKALIQYLILVVKKIPTHADFDEEAEDFEKTKEEYDYNFQKCDLVKQEIEKLRSQLCELYDVSSPVTPQPTPKPVKPVTFQVPISNSASSSPKNVDSDRRKSVITPIMPVHETTSTLEKLPRPVSAKDLNKRFSVAVRCKDPNTLYKTPTMVAQRSKSDSRTIHYVRLLPGIIEHETPNTPNSVYHLISPKQARMMKQQFSSNFQQQYQQPTYQGNYPSYQPQPQPIYQQPRFSQQPTQQPIYTQPTSQPTATFQQTYEPTYSVPPQYRSFQQHYQQHYQQQYQQQQQQQQPQYQVSTQSGNYVQNTYNNGLERIANNDQVQEYVGKQVGNLAQNQQVQRKVGAGVSNAAKNEKVQSTIGTTIASNTDNVLIQTLATNKTVQSGIGSAIANTAGNEKVQKAVGNAIHKAANDKDMQKKVAKGFLAIGKGAFSAAKTGASAGYQLYKDSEQQK